MTVNPFSYDYDRKALAQHLEESSLHHVHVRVEEEQDPNEFPGIDIVGETRYNFGSKPVDIFGRWTNPRMLSFYIAVHPGDGEIITTGDDFVANAHFEPIPVVNWEEGELVTAVYGGEVKFDGEFYVVGARFQTWLHEDHAPGLQKRLIERASRNKLFWAVNDAKVDAHNQFVRNRSRS